MFCDEHGTVDFCPFCMSDLEAENVKLEREQASHRIAELEAENAKLRDRLEQFEFVDTEYYGSDYKTEVHVYHGPEPTEKEALEGVSNE
jgi:hypothetical protein